MDLPVQQPIITPAVIEPTVPPQRESHNSFLVLVLIVSLVISTIAVFLFWQNQQLRSEITKLQASPIPSSIPVVVSPNQELMPSPTSTSSASPDPVESTNSATFEVN